MASRTNLWSASLRRSQRRQRARARLRWYLHRTGKEPLNFQQLQRIYSLLNRHHSRDPHLLHSILAALRATMTKKHPSWRCVQCHVVMKGTFPRCWKCGTEWHSCNDGTFVPPEVRQAYDQQSGQQQSWQGTTWNTQSSGSRSPRTKGRKNSNRGRHHGGGGDYYHQKGYGKGQDPQVPVPPMMPMMMPYPQPLMTAPMQPPVLDKGIGKGSQPHGAMVPPPPPMPATSGMTAASSIPTPWAPSMQMMPFPMAPTSPVVPVPQEDPIKEGQAQQKLSRLLKE